MNFYLNQTKNIFKIIKKTLENSWEIKVEKEITNF